MNSITRSGLSIGLCLMIASCGFQLRGVGSASVNVDRVFLQVASGVLMQVAIRDGLQSAKVAVVPTVGDAQLALRLIGENRQRRAASVTGQARVAEYEMSIALDYAIAEAGVDLVAPTRLVVERIYRIDRDNLTGSSEEQALLVREMEFDLVQQVLRALDAAANRAGS